MTNPSPDRPMMFGRTLNPLTLMWEFSDGSGVAIPDERMPQGRVISGLELVQYMVYRDSLKIERNKQ